MSNMSYCRFENTLSDLLDCQQALEELFAGDGSKLSRREAIAAGQLIQTCAQIAGLVAEEAELPDEEAVNLTAADAEAVLYQYVE